MKVILADGLKKFGEKKNADRKEVELFVSSHRMFKKEMGLEGLTAQIESHIKKPHSGSRGPPTQQQQDQRLHQLALYLNKDNNRQIFLLLQHILQQPQGITYETLSKKLKTDIITVSHYCCKLKKLRLIDWDHEKDGIVVFPRSRRPQDPINYDQTLSPESTYNLQESFIFQELTLTQNIWINVASEDTLTRGGITNEQVKRKVMKHAENKMVRRTVESMKYLQRSAERQGKVFEFKYKHETQQLKREIRKQEESRERRIENEFETQIDILDPTIQSWLEDHYPQFKGDNFLLNLINNKFKDYLSILGVKQSKRQCTPLKLNRYIKVLNYLHREGGMRESELRCNIVRDETPFNVGIMHKRSLLGILEGLKSLTIIVQTEGIYQPGWISRQLWTRKEEEPKKNMKDEDSVEPSLRKKIHIDPSEPKTDKKTKKSKMSSILKDPQIQYHKISEHDYKCQLFTSVVHIHLEKAVNRCLRKAFNRIVYVQRRRNPQPFIPQLQCLNLLEESAAAPNLNFSQSLQSFYAQLDAVTEERGRREEEIGVENELMKFVRKYPSRSGSFLRIKYGKNWQCKFEQLQRRGVAVTDEDGLTLKEPSLFLI